MTDLHSESSAPFWETKSLSEMTQTEWESLCDGCGRCCLEKLEDEDNGDIYYTDIVCEYLEQPDIVDEFDEQFADDESTEAIDRIPLKDVAEQKEVNYACRCSVYEERHIKVPACIWLKPEHLDTLKWLPTTCAYRMIHEGKGLADWHPLISGTTQTVHDAQISVAGKVISGALVPEEQWIEHIIEGML